MVNKDGIYAGYEKGFVSIISGETVQHLMVPSSQAIGTAVRFIVSDDKETGAYVGTGSSVYYINNGKVYSNSPSLKLDKMLYMRQMIKAQEGGYWFATVRGVSHYNSDKLVYSSNDQHDFSALVFSIAQQSDGSILFGTINGLWRYRNAKYEYLGANNSLLTNQINSIVKEPNSERFWLATAGHGVLILGGDSIWQITTRDGLASNTVQQLFYHESGVWASTNDGLSRIVPRSDGNVTIKNYTSSNGLPSNDVRSVFVYDGISFFFIAS
jgi:ligand-binding sensor domain-containing protein